MAVPEQRTRTGVAISFAREPGLVRTIRQVAAAAARQAGATESVVEAVRLAVGEACGVLVGDETPYDDRVRLVMDADSRLRVEVWCGSPSVPRQREPQLRDPWILLRGLANGLVVSEESGITRIAMSWPV